MSETSHGKTKLNVDIPLELKQALKVHCATVRTDMTVIVEQLIRSYLENQIKEKGVV